MSTFTGRACGGTREMSRYLELGCFRASLFTLIFLCVDIFVVRQVFCKLYDKYRPISCADRGPPTPCEHSHRRDLSAEFANRVGAVSATYVDKFDMLCKS